MPKEITYTSGESLNPNDPTGYVDVGWSKESVQIGTIQPGAQVAYLDPDTDEYLVASTVSPGFFVELNREGINRLIRSLRKARDRAFGADA